jgi:very-short-patch-repair endonuclease
MLKQVQHDKKRKDKRLNQLDVTVLRFDDSDIVYQLDKVIKEIEHWIDENEVSH